MGWHQVVIYLTQFTHIIVSSSVEEVRVLSSSCIAELDDQTYEEVEYDVCIIVICLVLHLS